MKLKLLLTCMLISFSVTKAEAKGGILYSAGETIEKIISLSCYCYLGNGINQTPL